MREAGNLCIILEIAREVHSGAPLKLIDIHHLDWATGQVVMRAGGHHFIICGRGFELAQLETAYRPRPWRDGFAVSVFHDASRFVIAGSLRRSEGGVGHPDGTNPYPPTSCGASA